MILENKFINKVVRNFYNINDIVILQHPYMTNLIKGLDGKFVIYESLNYEYKLKKQLLKDHPMSEFLIEKVKTNRRICII